jgi:UDP-N-acetylmuramyl pentapeptide synthase
MKVNILLKNIQTHKIIGDQNIIIDNLSQDSREEYTSRTLYFAVPGTQVDGHDYIDQVIKKGASCIICENLPEDIDVHTTYVCVTSVSEIIGRLLQSQELMEKQPLLQLYIKAFVILGEKQHSFQLQEILLMEPYLAQGGRLEHLWKL